MAAPFWLWEGLKLVLHDNGPAFVDSSALHHEVV